jgi:ubiquinone/menaquinone biosynthesis C-methylase UbiE
VDGVALPFADAQFVVTSASLVLSTILRPAARETLLQEMARVTAPNGVVIVYDFTVKKPWNRQVRAVSTRELARHWRPPDEVKHAAPFLPVLTIARQLPDRVARRLVRLLPRTHRMWVWRMSER